MILLLLLLLLLIRMMMMMMLLLGGAASFNTRRSGNLFIYHRVLRVRNCRSLFSSPRAINVRLGTAAAACFITAHRRFSAAAQYLSTSRPASGSKRVYSAGLFSWHCLTLAGSDGQAVEDWQKWLERRSRMHITSASSISILCMHRPSAPVRAFLDGRSTWCQSVGTTRIPDIEIS